MTMAVTLWKIVIDRLTRLFRLTLCSFLSMTTFSVAGGDS